MLKIKQEIERIEASRMKIDENEEEQNLDQARKEQEISFRCQKEADENHGRLREQKKLNNKVFLIQNEKKVRVEGGWRERIGPSIIRITSLLRNLNRDCNDHCLKTEGFVLNSNKR